LWVKNCSVENSIYRIALDKHSDFASIFDKKNNRELLQVGKPFRLTMFTENLSTDYPAWEIYKKVFDGLGTSITDNIKISVVGNGPLRAPLHVERTHENFRFIQYITLTDGAEDDRIAISNEFDWQRKKVLLNVEFPTTVSALICSRMWSSMRKRIPQGRNWQMALLPVFSVPVMRVR